MRDREEILIDFQGSTPAGDSAYLLEVLLDIRDQGQPIELIAEAQPSTKDRVVLQIGYSNYLLPDTMTSQDVVTLLRFFDTAQELDYNNAVSDKRPKIEIHLVPRDEIKMPVDPDAIVPFTQAEVTRDDSEEKLARHTFQPMEDDEEYCGVDGCHLSASDEIHNVIML